MHKCQNACLMSMCKKYEKPQRCDSTLTFNKFRKAFIKKCALLWETNKMEVRRFSISILKLYISGQRKPKSCIEKYKLHKTCKISIQSLGNLCLLSRTHEILPIFLFLLKPSMICQQISHILSCIEVSFHGFSMEYLEF